MSSKFFCTTVVLSSWAGHGLRMLLLSDDPHVVSERLLRWERDRDSSKSQAFGIPFLIFTDPTVTVVV